jgi:hypothetical protein
MSLKIYRAAKHNRSAPSVDAVPDRLWIAQDQQHATINKGAESKHNDQQGMKSSALTRKQIKQH